MWDSSGRRAGDYPSRHCAGSMASRRRATTSGAAKFGGMSVSNAKRLKELEAENARLKRLLAESLVENQVTCEVLPKEW